ncbi:hypothetical protein DFH08DRAFT_823030 [Mycena albidolilacea]|uniref:Uncharacterized protein n=1 Tax=Mycena albidolilacea TaxID=1033008 RepID=A0AAD6Z7H9_9AGAR|nr:hypothetical protein DFH08DRAFT_823030 [Mycena albidolilacea]
MSNSMRTTSRKLYGDWAREYARRGGRGTAGMRAESARAVGEARAGEGCERVKSAGVQRGSAQWASEGRAMGVNEARWVHDLRVVGEKMRGARDSGGTSTGLQTRDAAGMHGGYDVDVRREGVRVGMRRERAGYGVRVVLGTTRGGTHGCERTAYVRPAGVWARWVQCAQCSGRAAVGTAWNVPGHGGCTWRECVRTGKRRREWKAGEHRQWTCEARMRGWSARVRVQVSKQPEGETKERLERGPSETKGESGRQSGASGPSGNKRAKEMGGIDSPPLPGYSNHMSCQRGREFPVDAAVHDACGACSAQSNRLRWWAGIFCVWMQLLPVHAHCARYNGLVWGITQAEVDIGWGVTGRVQGWQWHTYTQHSMVAGLAAPVKWLVI